MAKKIGTCQCTFGGLRQDFSTGDMEMVLKIPGDSRYAAKQIADDAQGKNLALSLSRYSKKRTISQNDYLWAMLTEISQVMRDKKESIYVQMVERYGDWYQIAVPPKQAERAKKLFRVVTDEETVTVNGGKITKFHGYPGSSQYDTEQMNRLIDGVISECKELGIPTDKEHYIGFYTKEQTG